ncbi:MAG: T9SS type A sorting domain-containing protein [Bacteroidales bacterium]|nr:T9SS type A sorting domain-containing protein [Bacteroidales bacterium]
MKQSARSSVFLVLLTLLIYGIPSAFAQISQGGLPLSSQHNLDGAGVPQLTLELSPAQQAEKNSSLGVYEPGLALFAGWAVKTALNPASSGKWEVVNGNIHLWRQQIHVPGALGVGLNFDAFELSEGARLFVYNPDKSVVLGAFDHHNNNEFQIFSTQVIPGQTVIIEYQEPYYEGKANAPVFGLLQLESAIYLGYGGGVNVFDGEKGLGDAEPCHININCQEGNIWQDQKRGVARMLMRVGTSYFWCTGSLVNNTAQDASPMFLSAAHCGANANERDMMYWQFYFNYERPACENVGTPPQHLIVGADLLSLAPIEGGSDFRLMMLHQDPPPHWRPYWNGWNRTNNTSFSGVGIHHPTGDAKKISTYNTQLLSSNPLVSGQQMAANSAWRVSWTPTATGHGVVQGGSSGSPIFNSQGLIIGTLTGGSSSCSNPWSPDYYGKMWYHWDKNGVSDQSRVASFLDPLNTGVDQVFGFDPYADNFPSPGFVETTTENDNQVTVNWYKPGSAPNPEGWFTYVNNYSHLTWSAPERAVVFDAPMFGLNYPLTLSKISHMFVQHSSYPWPNNQFTFKIYASDGLTLLYESPVLIAVSQQVIEHSLPQALVLDNYFYVAVRPVDASGHPSSLMRQVNFGQGYSFYGSADNWTPHNANNMAGSYTYLTRIFVEASKSNELMELSSTTLDQLMDQSQASSYEPGTEAELIVNAAPPSGYRVFRNGSNIHSTTNTEVLSYTDNSPLDGLSYYQVTANYSSGESEPSPRAYMLRAAPCGETIGQFPYVQTFGSSFSSQCWLDYGNAAWQLNTSLQVAGNTINPAEGDQFFSVLPAGSNQTDQWLVMPAANLGQQAQPALRFKFNGIKQASSPVLTVWVSKNGTSFRKVWDSNMHPVFATGTANLSWQSTTLNLKDFANQENVRIAFQVAGQGEGFFALDKIELLSANAITYNVTVTVNPDYSGTFTGAGSYLSGQAVSLKANPNLGYLFNGWIQGSNMLSNQLEYSFVMPAGNVSLTASFTSDPTSVPLTKEGKPALELYPNPARDQVRLRFNESLAAASIVLYNAQAQQVAVFEPGSLENGDELQISTSGYPQGIYFIQVRSLAKARILKLVITD